MSEHLTRNVTDTICRHVERMHPEVYAKDPERVRTQARENAYWLCSDWPEDQGFGSSDSFGALQSTLADLGIRTVWNRKRFPDDS